MHESNVTIAASIRLPVKEILRIGLPAGVQTIMITVSNIMVQFYINGFEELAIAVFATYYKAESFIYLPGSMVFGWFIRLHGAARRFVL